MLDIQQLLPRARHCHCLQAGVQPTNRPCAVTVCRRSAVAAAGAAHAAVYVYHVGTAKVVAQLRGHTVNVRSIFYDGETNRLASCSFDKSVKVYEQP